MNTFGGLLYSMLTINALIYFPTMERVELQRSCHKKTEHFVRQYIFSLISCNNYFIIYTSKHHIVHLKYMYYAFTSAKETS